MYLLRRAATAVAVYRKVYIFIGVVNAVLVAAQGFGAHIKVFLNRLLVVRTREIPTAVRLFGNFFAITPRLVNAPCPKAIPTNIVRRIESAAPEKTPIRHLQRTVLLPLRAEIHHCILGYGSQFVVGKAARVDLNRFCAEGILVALPHGVNIGSSVAELNYSRSVNLIFRNQCVPVRLGVQLFSVVVVAERNKLLPFAVYFFAVYSGQNELHRISCVVPDVPFYGENLRVLQRTEKTLRNNHCISANFRDVKHPSAVAIVALVLRHIGSAHFVGEKFAVHYGNCLHGKRNRVVVAVAPFFGDYASFFFWKPI